MKLIRFGERSREKPGVLLEDGTCVDVSGFTHDFDKEFFTAGSIHELPSWLRHNLACAPRTPISGVRLGPPVCMPSKIICIGLNYLDHATESKMQIPGEPVFFLKAPSSLSGPNDGVMIPRGGEKLDWEVELAVIIGKEGRYIPKEQAFGHVAGYALHNDYSERCFQLERGGQWVKGKSADTFAPLGPFLATPDEIPSPGQLSIWLKVNSEYRQKSNTSNMIFDIPTLISYVSDFMTLLPGDVISTGTPAGVGLGMIPQRYLQPGNIVELGIDGLGSAQQKVLSWKQHE